MPGRDIHGFVRGVRAECDVTVVRSGSRWSAVTATVLTLAGAVTLAGGEPTNRPTDEFLLVTSGRNLPHHYGDYGFAITGSTPDDLYPGAHRKVELTIVNPYPFRIRVHRLTGKLTGSSLRGCAPIAANLDIRPYAGRLPLIVQPRGWQRAGHLELQMPNSVSNACQKAKFTIRLTGDATKVDR
jgi:hypothetical protein